MKVKIKRVDKTLPLPEYKTKGSVGFDLYCREDWTIPPKSLELMPANIIVETPKDHMFIVVPRSSTFKRKGLIQPNSIGVIDQDYSGEKDEVRLLFYNMTDEPVEIKKGERVAQGIFVRVTCAEWEEQEKMGESRGGFGSTGTF